MKKIFLIIICFVATTLVSAQTPTLQWAKSMGGTSYDQGLSIAVDAAGNVYTTGSYTGTVDFDPGAGIFYLTSNGVTDIFVTKFDVSGNFVWAKSIGGTAADRGNGIVIDSGGNILLTGYFGRTVDFDPNGGIDSLTSVGSYDIFISKLNSSGNLLWAKDMGGLNNDWANSITVDSTGNVYTTGYFEGTSDFDPGIGIFNLIVSGPSEAIFVSKLDSSGNFVWAKSFGGYNQAIGQSITTDASENVYTTGYFRGTIDFDPGSGVYNLTSGPQDIFISKLDAVGNFVWAKNIGGETGAGPDYGISVAVDKYGNVFSTGFFQGTVDFDPGAGTDSLTAIFSNIYISKLDASGNFVWAKSIGDTTGGEGYSIVLDAVGDIYIGGAYYGTIDFDPRSGNFNLTG